MRTPLQRVAAVSLAFNVILAVLLCWAYARLWRADSKLVQGSMPVAEKRPVKPSNAVNGAILRVSGRVIDWRRIESSDYREYIQNLRSIGCPEATVRDIIIADVNQLFDEKRKVLLGRAKPVPYWESSLAARFARPPVDAAALNALKVLDSERRGVIKELLGVEVPADDDYLVKFYLNPNAYILDFLPPGKRAYVLSLREERNARRAGISTAGSVDDASVAKALNDAQKAFEQELAGRLTPEEYREYQLRLSLTASRLSNGFHGFEPTEEEYERIFDLNKAFDDRFGVDRPGVIGVEEFERYDQARRELDGKTREILGAQRFEEYQREGNSQYRAIADVLNSLQIPRASATEVWKLKQAAEEQIRRVAQDQTLSREQRRSAAQAIAGETERAAAKAIGPDALESLRKSPGAGLWLRNLRP